MNQRHKRVLLVFLRGYLREVSQTEVPLGPLALALSAGAVFAWGYDLAEVQADIHDICTSIEKEFQTWVPKS